MLPARWGRGFATELALTSIEVAFDSLGLAEVIAYTQPDNLASRRVMEKAGMLYEGELIHEDMPHVLYRCPPRSSNACRPTSFTACRRPNRRSRC